MKFQYSHGSGILMSNSDDDMVICGHCKNQCEVPKEFGLGHVINDFFVQDLLGSGAIRNVYVTDQFSLDRQVALKILHGEFVNDHKFQEDFTGEARSVANLNNIIQAYNLGGEDGIPYFAMDLVEVLDLNSVLKRKGSIVEFYGIDIVMDTAKDLSYAWDKSRLVYRDIKPENIMVALDGICKVMDLGLSQRAGENFDDEDQISGTPQFISPEQVLGIDIDLRTDFYCLGATLFPLTAGRFVFEADSLP